MRWKSSKSEHDASIFLNDLKKYVNVSGKRSSIGSSGFFSADVTFEALAGCVVWSKNLPSGNLKSIIKTVYVEIANTGSIEPNSFLEACRRTESAYFRKTIRSYVVLSTLSIRHSASLKTIGDDDGRIRFSKRRPKGFEEMDSLSYPPWKILIPPTDYTWVRTEVETRDPVGAIEKGTSLLNYHRALWNLQLTFRASRRSNAITHKTPVNPICNGPLYTIHNPDGTLTSAGYYWESSYCNPPKIIDSDADLREIRPQTNSLNRLIEKSPLRNTLRRLLNQYVQAQDESNLQSSFLRLWSVLEMATGTTFHARFDDLIKRASFLADDRKYVRAMLRFLRDHRNQVTHHGYYVPDAEDLVYSLKDVVDTVIAYLILNCAKFNSLEEFGKFLDLPQDEEHLHTMHSSIELALERVINLK